ncbi:hypothetical protein Tco_0997393, partial [Tanacetum coccineum]
MFNMWYQSLVALDLGFKVLWSKNEGTDEVLEGTAKVLKGTAQEYESTAGANLSTAEVYSKVLLLFESTAHYAQSTARCESTASFIREGKIIMARIWRFIEEVIMKKIEYCLFDVVVEFH